MPTPPRILTHKGESLPIHEWAERRGLAVETIRARLDTLGWTVADAIDTPADRRFRRGGRHTTDAPRPAPKLLKHPSGRAYCRWRVNDRVLSRYFGPWGSDAAREGYARFCGEWAAGHTAMPAADGEPVSVAAMIVAWLKWVEREYRKAGRITSEVHGSRAAAAVPIDLYGEMKANEFGPAQLRAVRERWIAAGLARRTINVYCWRMSRAWRFGAGQGLVRAEIANQLAAVEKLRAGRTTAPERRRVQDVPERDVTRTFRHLSPIIARRVKLIAMIRLQRLVGMRPGELCGLRPADLDRRGKVWVYEVHPDLNKNEHRDKPQRYFLGPRAQRILTPYLEGPADRSAWGIDTSGYRRAVALACKRGGVPHWHPHRLRHSLATAVATALGIEHAAAALGDHVETARRVYVHVDPADAARLRVAELLG